MQSGEARLIGEHAPAPGNVATGAFDGAPGLPQGIGDTGLDEGFLVDLVVKVMYRMALELPSRICGVVCLPIWIVERVLEEARSKRLVEPLGQAGG